MFFFAAVMATHFSLVSLLSRHPLANAPAPTCGITTVSHKFVGTPGTAFQYGGDRYQIPASGWIELISVKGVSTYEFRGRALPLNVWPRDPFGTETVQIP